MFTLACALRRPLKWIPVIRSLREDGITVSADFGWNPDLSPMQLLSIVRHCEFIFPNEHEARAITGTSSALSALERLQDWVRVPVIKLGARGAMLMIEGKVYRQPALRVEILDATGAGGCIRRGVPPCLSEWIVLGRLPEGWKHLRESFRVEGGRLGRAASAARVPRHDEANAGGSAAKTDCPVKTAQLNFLLTLSLAGETLRTFRYR